MRLVSQDGIIDVPYENVIIACENNRDGKYTIYARCSHCLGMATYSTEDKALKVMEMLRKRYLDYLDVKFETFWYSNDYPKVFQFPDDSDVEV